jgi:putative RNA 2'-phosphotransferase
VEVITELNSDLDVKVSKLMSYLLRHNPKGLKMDERGFVRLDNLMRRVKERYDVDNDLIRNIVYASDKTRFQIMNEKIRALYGHTIDVKVDLPEDKSVEVLYHGTTAESASKILERGLRSMKRRWVHLSTTRETAREVGKRRTQNPVILVIDAEKARRTGIRLYKATKRVYLSKRIPPKYIKKIEQTRKIT